MASVCNERPAVNEILDGQAGVLMRGLHAQCVKILREPAFLIFRNSIFRRFWKKFSLALSVLKDF
jgi:hypothetical protein